MSPWIVSGLDVEPAILAVADPNAKRFHHFECHRDVGNRDQGAVHFDRRDVLRVGESHQKPAQKLARHVPLNGREAAVEPAGFDRDRWATGAEIRLGVGPEAVERLQ